MRLGWISSHLTFIQLLTYKNWGPDFIGDTDETKTSSFQKLVILTWLAGRHLVEERNPSSSNKSHKKLQDQEMTQMNILSKNDENLKMESQVFLAWRDRSSEWIGFVECFWMNNTSPLFCLTVADCQKWSHENGQKCSWQTSPIFS